MKDNYVNLSTFNFGKHSYSVIRNNDKVIYFEFDNNKYLMPIVSFSLYDNEGKSLTSVNQHFFMNELVNRINIACKKGIFVSDEEITHYLDELKSKIENDAELKKLFKGSFMKEIDEENFENNKKNLLSYLDKYRFDTFVNYNNVSIFNGSLDKNDNSLSSFSNNALDVVNEKKEENIDNNVVDEVDNKQSVEHASNVQDTLQDDIFESLNTIQNNDEPAVNVNDFFNNSVSGDKNSGVSIESNESVVGSKDYFDNSNVQKNINSDESSFSEEELNNIDNVQSINVSQDNNIVDNNVQGNIVDTQSVDNSSVQSNENVTLNDNNVNTSVASNVDQIASLSDVIQSDVDLNNVNQSPTFEQTNNVNQSSTSEQINSVNQDIKTSVENSYLEQVKNRMEKSSLSKKEFDNEIGVLGTAVDELGLDKTFVSDTNTLPELESISAQPLETQEPVQKEKKSVGLIIFIIILVILLIAFTFFLYNYVF